MIAADGTHAEIIDLCQGYIDNSGLTDVDVTVMVRVSLWSYGKS